MAVILSRELNWPHHILIYTDRQWLFVRLPNGINQLLIEGFLQADPGNLSGIMLDDITVKPCEQFGESVYA